jgi:hypothetical protein
MKKIITLLTLGILSVFMQACTTYGDPYYQPQYSSVSVQYSPRPYFIPEVINHQQTQRYSCKPLRVYEPYTYQIHDIQSDTVFNIQDKRQIIERGNCRGQATPTFFYIP